MSLYDFLPKNINPFVSINDGSLKLGISNTIRVAYDAYGERDEVLLLLLQVSVPFLILPLSPKNMNFGDDTDFNVKLVKKREVERKNN